MSMGNAGSLRHGRQADAPQEIPPAGWKDVLFRTYSEFKDDRVTLIAAAVTYYLLLALFPSLTALVSIYGLIADAHTVNANVHVLASFFPEGGISIVDEQLERLATTKDSTLGIALAISVAIAFWSASSGIKTMFEAMNIAYDEREHRNFFVLSAIALLFTVGGIVGAILMISAAVLVPVALEFVGLGNGLEWLVRIGAYVLLAVVLMVGLALLYRFGPCRQQAQWRWVSPGAALATAIILVVSLLFSWYAANFGHYDKTYGSLGGLIALLTWMWICLTAVISGAELNAEAERQTRKDSTTGDAQPMGLRGASAADTLGPLIGETSREEHNAAMHGPDCAAGDAAAQRRCRTRRQPLVGALALALPAVVLVLAVTRRHEPK